MFGPNGPSFRELLVQALSSTEGGYDLIAPKFDATPFRTPDEVLEPMARVIGPVDRGLDVCCGTGAALKHLAPLCREEAVGIDFSQGMLDEARRRLGNDPKIRLVRGDVLSLRFSAEFDVVTCVGAFGHIVEEDEQRFLDGIARALKRGGRFVFATSEMPPVTSRWWWMARGFNAAMRVRNAVLSPPFVMYYLTFLWPEIAEKLERAGFRATAHRRLCRPPYERAIVVEATLL